MAKILLIETATDVCSAAIAADGRLLALAEDLPGPSHAARLTLLIEQCTRETGFALATLDAVALSRGPGSYTALRVGASVAKGICYALDKPLIALDTLQALAAASLDAWQGLREEVLLMPMLDARRQEVWTAVYDAALREIVPAQPLILKNNMFELFLEKALQQCPGLRLVLSGNGVKKINFEPDVEKVVVSLVQNCSAQYLTGLAEEFFQNSDFQEVAYFEPFYMKLPNITTPNKPLF